MSFLNQNPIGPIATVTIHFDGDVVYRFEGRDDGQRLRGLANDGKAALILAETLEYIRKDGAATGAASNMVA